MYIFILFVIPFRRVSLPGQSRPSLLRWFILRSAEDRIMDVMIMPKVMFTTFKTVVWSH